MIEIMVGIVIGMVISLVITFITLYIHEPYKCDGTIVMNDHELYLSLSEKDVEALEHKSYALLRLKREHFKGFNE